MPSEPTICAATRVACGEVAGRAGAGLAEEQLLGGHAAERDLDRADELGARLREALLEVGVGEQAERVAALDDRQHLELAVVADEVRDDRVAGLVGRDRAASPRSVYSTGCLRPISSVIFACWTSCQSIASRAVAQRPHQRLVEEVLDHHRRVAERHRGERVAALFLVELGDVRLLVEVVVDDLAAAGAARQVEVDRAVEAARAQQRGVEVGGAVGGADDEDVGGARQRLAGSGARRGSQRFDRVDERSRGCAGRTSAGRTTAAG